MRPFHLVSFFTSGKVTFAVSSNILSPPPPLGSEFDTSIWTLPSLLEVEGESVGRAWRPSVIPEWELVLIGGAGSLSGLHCCLLESSLASDSGCLVFVLQLHGDSCFSHLLCSSFQVSCFPQFILSLWFFTKVSGPCPGGRRLPCRPAPGSPWAVGGVGLLHPQVWR